MAGSTFGRQFRITTWGESHGEGLGVVVDGVPAGFHLTEEDIQFYLNRRKPGQSDFTTPRKEGDIVSILSGVFEGKTTGAPISLLVRNENQRSKDYSNIMNLYRPGHADYTFDERYGFRDYRGGGRSSGRETIGRVAGGAIATLILKELGIEFTCYTLSVGPISCDPSHFDASQILQNSLFMPDAEAYEKASAYLQSLREKGDSSGGICECLVTGLPAGIGEPVFSKLDADLAHAIFSIGAVKGFEIGDGFAAAKLCGSENNDAFTVDESGKVSTKTNHCGGILGGISNGMPLLFRAAFKPTPSISIEQESITKDHKNTSLCIHGRHDPIIVPRAVVVVECMAAIVILDDLMGAMPAKLESIREFLKN